MTIRAYWPRAPKPGNFGDVLTPWLIEKISGEAPEWAPAGEGVHLVVGSILKHAGPGVHVWGTGAMRSGDHCSPEATYHAVRGPISRDCVLRDGGDCPPVYGDPACLLPLFYALSNEKTHRLGIIPHYVDREPAAAAWGNLDGARLIDVLRADPLEVVDEIRSCEAIVSSSLHGLIVAQSYGIPAAWIGCVGERELNGDATKFADWYLANGQPVPEPWQVTGRETLEDLAALAAPLPLGVDRHRLLEACPFAPQRATPAGAGRPPLVISFYTPQYADGASRLRDDCRRLGLPYRIEPAADRGDWLANCRFKGEYVWQCLQEADRPVLWIDADGRLLKYPKLLENASWQGVDFAARPKPADHTRPFYVGTLYFGNSPGGRAVARAWAECCAAASGKQSDEWALAEVWPKVCDQVPQPGELPEQYCTWPTERDQHIADPIILHGLSGNASKYATEAAA